MTAEVCLIIPPSPFLLDDRVFPSLGILRVAASLESQGASVDLLDLSGVKNYLEVVELYLRERRMTKFGITATTPQYPSAHAIARRLRELRPRAELTIGGPHPTLVAAAAKAERKKDRCGRAMTALGIMRHDFDTVVAGDGDLIPLDLMFFGGMLVDGDDPKTPLFMTDLAYEQTPLPARHLIDLKSYNYQIEGHRSTSLIAQLGCPFACNFCGGRLSPMLRRIRIRSTDNILSEVEMLYRAHGYTGFMFYDDELNVSKNMIELMNGLSDLQEKLKTEFRLRGFVKSEIFTIEQAQAMYRAGFRWTLTGFESGNPRILDNINKKATRDDNTRCVDIAHRAGLKVKALMSIGHAGESHETIADVKDWLIETKPEDFDVTVITTYPGTPYYDEAIETAPNVWTFTAKKSGDRLHAYELDYTVTADYYKGDPDAAGGYKAYVYTDYISSEELVIERDKVERDVRTTLGIPFNPSVAAQNYEHSMGQSLPGTILRRSEPLGPAPKRIVKLPVVK